MSKRVQTPRLARAVAAALLSYTAAASAAATTTCAPGGASGEEMLAALQRGLRPSVLQPGETPPAWSLPQRMAQLNVPGVAVAVIVDGKVTAAAGYGVLQAGGESRVDADTLFNVGSISKIATAAISLRLVAQGKLELDRDVNSYLKSWQIPPAAAGGGGKVSLRMLLSHTAGLTVHGFPDFLPGEAVPTTLQSLDGKAPARNEPVRLQRPPGLLGDYSGGGTLVEQLLIEDVSGKALEQVAQRELAAALKLSRSTFASPLPADTRNVAKAHDSNGRPEALPRGWQTFPQQAPAGWWTTARELGELTAALIRSYQGRGDYLPQPLALQMMSEVAPSWHGLGPRLDGAGGTRVFHHGGSNDSYHAWMEGYPHSGAGFVILTNSARGAQLRGEIRNALSDAIGCGVNPPLHTVMLDPVAAGITDFAGRYRLERSFPLDQRRALTDIFDVDELEIRHSAGALSVRIPDETGALLALSPTRFVAPTVFATQYEFHRDAFGKVRAVSVEHAAGRAYYRRIQDS